MLASFARKMDVEYTESLDGITADKLKGFFVGWKSPHSPQKHLSILKRSAHVILALDPDSQRVIGFVTALSDGTQSAFIPLLEVLPDYQRRGIGIELMKRLLKKINAIPAIDVTCDPQLQGFY